MYLVNDAYVNITLQVHGIISSIQVNYKIKFL